jgi:hypothetical protein
MKGLIFAGLSAFLMSTSVVAAPLPSFATTAQVRLNETSSPNDLVSLAYRGHFSSQGIPFSLLGFRTQTKLLWFNQGIEILSHQSNSVINNLKYADILIAIRTLITCYLLTCTF